MYLCMIAVFLVYFIICYVFHSILLFLCCISITDDPIAGKGVGVHFQDFAFAERKGENFKCHNEIIFDAFKNFLLGNLLF